MSHKYIVHIKLTSSDLPFVSGAVRNMWMKARALKVPKIMYIFQLIDQSRGGTAKARMQFHVQLLAVARETAFARTLAGKISEGYVQDVGPQVVAKVATKRYEQATIPLETALWLFGTTHEISLSLVSGLGWPYEAWSAPVVNRKTLIRNDPTRSAGRRPNLSRYTIAGRVMATLMMYWIDAVRSSSAIPAPRMMNTM
jgi:hypothetical protein